TRGADDVVVSWLPARTPRSAQGFSSSRWISSHHTVMAVSIAITMAVIIALTSSASDALPALAERRRVTSRRLVLRNVVLVLAGDAVVVRPAVDDRQLRPPVAVHRRRVRRLPFERRRLPRVRLRPLAAHQAVGDVDDEDHLRRRDDDRGDGDRLVDRGGRRRDEIARAVRV